ncbi:MAG: GAF domain-containing protein [Acidobacteriota bacterium]
MVERNISLARGVCSLFDRIATSIRSTLSCTHASLYVFDERRSEFRLECSSGAIAGSAGSWLVSSPDRSDEFDALQCSKQLRAGHIYFSHGHSSASGADSRMASDSVLAVPLMASSGAIVGALRCDGAVGRKRTFSTVDASLLGAFAASTAGIVERFVRLRARSQITDVLKQAAAAAAPRGTIRETLQNVTTALTQAFRAEVGSLYLWDDSKKRLVLVAAEGPNEPLLGSAEYSLGEGVTGDIPNHRVLTFKSWGELVHHPTCCNKYNHKIWGDAAEPVRNFLGCRIRSESGLLGVWKVANMQPSDLHPDSYFTDEDAELAQVLSTFLAYIIESAERDRRTSSQLDFLANGTLAVLRATTPDDALAAAMIALEQSGFPNAMLSLYNEGQGRIIGTLCSGPKFDNIIEETRRDIDGDDVLAVVLRSGSPVFVPDSSKDPSCEQNAIRRSGVVSQYVLPLTTEDELVGTLQVDLGRVDDISLQEKALLDGFGKCISVAVARLRAERRLAELTETVAGGSRFIVAEALAGMVVHSLGHKIDDVLAKLDTDLKTREIREHHLVGKTLRRWREEFGRLESDLRGSLDFVKSPPGGTGSLTDAHGVIRDTIDSWIAYIHNEKCVLKHRLDASLTSAPITAHALREILSVLFVNAVQAHARKIELTTCNVCEVLTSHRHFIPTAIRIEVVDNGDGIVAQDVEEIFGPKYSTKPEKSGTGLGLFIARLLARTGGGDLECVKHDRAKGAAFSLILPVSDKGRA